MTSCRTALRPYGRKVIDNAGRVQPTNASGLQRSGRDADLPPDAEGTGNYDYDGESDFFGLLPDNSQGGSGSGVNSAVRKLAVPEATTTTAGVVGPDAEGNPNADAEDSSNIWMIIGISVGVVVVVAIAAGVGSYVYCTRRRQRAAAQGGDAASQRSQSRR
ncbi:uncharacterized protein LOC129600855 isoform X2 [Paramacrobiotus metropolitanus]|uniref:uncharacterized protein LOC129600855 isoform X2 n=1 Tax=Paramacrobiotus metropolitanus TaxID=2943436 RepID=UPI00244639A2|nr:uncharacterized protein LOC129600855 isoform X2 [Paramacrobiotus metropolitanus]